MEGITFCSDCGSPLSEEIIETANDSKITLNDFQKRLLYTIGVVLIWRILVLIPAPGINFEIMEEYLSRTGNILLPPSSMFTSVFALGIMPYVSAYVMIEILALVVPPLKSWRKGSYQGRRKLKTVALATTFLLGIVQGYGIAKGLEGMMEGQIVRNPGLSFQIVLAVTLTAGAFLTIWIAELITKKGIGHGISILILSGFTAGFSNKLSGIRINKEYYEHSPFEIFLFVIVLGIALIALVVFAEKSHRRIPVKFDDGKEAYIPLKLTTAGIVPVSWAASIVMLPVTIFSFTNSPSLQKIAVELSPGKLIYSVANVITIFFLYYLFTAFFYKPRKLIDFLKSKNAYIAIESGQGERYIDRSLEIMAFFGAMYLCFLVLVPEIAIRVLNIPIFIGGIGMIKTVGIGLDVFGESRLRRKEGNLIKIAEFHDLQKAGLSKSLLEQHDITSHLRGYYHRALLYFFGPYIEISLLVPEDKAEEAREIINCYIE
ncbi:MAG: hypothetical protein Q8K51_12280 [Nitrospirota bacterium]|nr:hypothetical protein [Nitrospirota bacterium]